jgi:methylphosphotriester-DNA--protein-cysteine methyltransferase
MKKQDNSTPATNTVKAIHAFLREGEEPISNEQIKAALAADGVDPKKAVSEIKLKVKQAQNRQRLAGIRRGIEETASSVSEAGRIMGAAASDLMSQIKGVIDRIALTQPQTAKVYYRKLEDAKPEDLESLLADLTELSEEEGGEDKDGT